MSQAVLSPNLTKKFQWEVSQIADKERSLAPLYRWFKCKLKPPKKYEQLLKEAEYDTFKTAYLVQGFKKGFSMCYNGPLHQVKREAPNLKLRVGSQTELWNKVMLEVQAGRYAGPFKRPPFEFYVQSPIRLVPKDKRRKTKLIFHLSYPKTGDSVNSGIPKYLTTVKYPDFNEAIKLCVVSGVAANCAKSDMPMAFRHVPVSPQLWYLLILKANHPTTNELFYFLDKFLPFGSSISCKIFQEFSNSVAHLVYFRTKVPLVNYLDDYFFVALLKQACDEQVHVFL